MTQVIVTVHFEKSDPLDLSLPWEVPVEQIVEAMEEIFKVHRNVNSTLGLAKLIDNGKQNLSPEETLADANIVFGDQLQLLVHGSPYLFLNQGKRYSLDKNLIVIGRTTPQRQVDIDLTDLDTQRVISRQHAAIIRRDEDYFIKDTDSSNGVWVNNRRISTGTLRRLENSDVLQFGGSRGVELIFGIRN